MKISFKLLLILFGFLSNMGFIYSSEGEPYLRCYNQIITTFAKEVQKNYGLICIGTGGFMHDEIEDIAIFLSSNKEANIDESRDMVVLATEKLVSLFKNNKEIQSFLKKTSLILKVFLFQFSLVEKIPLPLIKF